MSTAFILLFVIGIIGITMSMVLFAIQSNFSKAIKGLDSMAVGLFMLSISLLLLLARNHIPDFFSIIIANLMALSGIILIGEGIKKLAHPTSHLSKKRILFILGSMLLPFLWFTYINNSIQTRTIIISLYILSLVSHQIIYLLKNFADTPGRKILIASLTLVVTSRLFRTFAILTQMDAPLSIFDESKTNLVMLILPSIIIPLLTIGVVMLVSEKLVDRLETLSRYDELTNCFNKKAILDELKREMHRAQRRKTKVCVMLMDLDNFKETNDQYGHLAGDEVLVDFAKKVTQLSRETDQFGRFGGDEFVAVLPDTSIEQAEMIAGRINTTGQLSDPQWSVSIGIAEYLDADSFDSMLTRADNMLYKAKRNGKNQVWTDEGVQASL